jgi:hypothetical protein
MGLTNKQVPLFVPPQVEWNCQNQYVTIRRLPWARVIEVDIMQCLRLKLSQDIIIIIFRECQRLLKHKRHQSVFAMDVCGLHFDHSWI